MEKGKNFLRTIPFTEFSLWDVKRYILNDTQSSFQLVSLSKLIYQRSEKIKLYNFPEKDFKILGVNNKIGLFDAYIEKGKNINQPYKKVYDGNLIYNPYRINVGSIGMKTPEIQNELISPAYVVFGTKKELLSEYLFLIFKTETFNKIINDNTTGSVRQNLKFDTLEKIKIPLPSIEKQKQLICEYSNKMHLAEEQEKKAVELENGIEEYLNNILKLNSNVIQKKKKGLHFTFLNKISRWDTTYIIRNMPVLQSKYPIRKFKEVIKNFNKNSENKSIRINSKDYPNDEFVYIGMEHIEKETGNLMNTFKVKGKEIKSQTLQVPKGFLLYGKLRPYLNKYWINRTSYKNIICSSEFFVFNVKKSINKQFFKYILASNIIQKQIKDKTSGARMPRINEETFYDLQFPLPDYDIQNEIANHIDNLKNQINFYKDNANKNRIEAIKKFELIIFTKNEN